MGDGLVGLEDSGHLGAYEVGAVLFAGVEFVGGEVEDF